MLPKYRISNSPGRINLSGLVILYSPLIATSPGRHDAVELAKLVRGSVVEIFPITE